MVTITSSDDDTVESLFGKPSTWRADIISEFRLRGTERCAAASPTSGFPVLLDSMLSALADTPDRPWLVPFAGTITPGNGRILVATGMNKWGFTNAPAVAAVNIAGIVNGESPSWTHAFSSTRIPRSGLPTLARASANVATHLVGGWASALTTKSDPAPGQGNVRFEHGHLVARSTNCTNTDVLSVDGKCPHPGAALRWNPAEQTWDCPLHGSRFHANGRLLHGPAVDDLARRTND